MLNSENILELLCRYGLDSFTFHFSPQKIYGHLDPFALHWKSTLICLNALDHQSNARSQSSSVLLCESKQTNMSGWRSLMLFLVKQPKAWPHQPACVLGVSLISPRDHRLFGSESSPGRMKRLRPINGRDAPLKSDRTQCNRHHTQSDTTCQSVASLPAKYICTLHGC